MVIGSIRYMVSIIDLNGFGFDPNSRPYPPVQWTSQTYWQFTNRHNPYLDVTYQGGNENIRIRDAQIKTASIGLRTQAADEPMQMYLDTNPNQMIVWPILAFPYTPSSDTVDIASFRTTIEDVTALLSTKAPSQPTFEPGALDSQLVTVPASLQLYNPYIANAATTNTASPSAAATASSTAAASTAPSISGKLVTNLSPNTVTSKAYSTTQAQSSFETQQTQIAASNLSMTKAVTPTIVGSQTIDETVGLNPGLPNALFAPRFLKIYGFSIYNPQNGEAFIVQLVDSDQDIPDQLPKPTKDATYDPYYVRVAFVNTFTCYNMSIIVPSLVHDRNSNWARLATQYDNVLSGTNELSLGYMYSLYDTSHNFDSLFFTPYNSDVASTAPNLAASETCIFTNYPYSIKQIWIFNPGSLFGGIDLGSLLSATTSRLNKAQVRSDAVVTEFGFDPLPINWIPPKYAPPYFVCRRQNWNADCHLMQATHTSGSALYVAYGGGDIVPFKLDPELPIGINKKQPAHMFQLTETITDRPYISVKNFSVANTPFVLGVTNQGGVPQYMNFSINSSSQLSKLVLTTNQPLSFPSDCYVIGQSSTSLTSIASINTLTGLGLTDTGGFVSYDDSGKILDPSYQVIPYNNLVYLIRAVSNVQGLGLVGNIGISAGFLVDTYVASAAGSLVLAQGARHKRSGLQFFGSSYTPTTMVDSLDTLDFTSITGVTFYAPTIFIPVPELDAGKEFIANLFNFLSQQVWTLIYPEVVVTTNGGTANGIQYNSGFNIDNNGKPILTLQKLHFIYDTMVTMFTPNDLAHKYPLQPKEKVLAMTNDQILEGICWRSTNVQPYRVPPTNVSAQQILPVGIGMDAPNIIYSPKNRPVITTTNSSYMGMSLNSIVSLSGVAFNIEEAAMTQQTNDPTGTKTKLISAVSSTTNLLIGVVFDYDNNDLGTLPSPLTSDTKPSTSTEVPA
jgi:hypothetical protein